MTDRAAAPAPTDPTAVPPASDGALLTVTGSDRPGVTAALFAALDELGPHPVEVLDVEQVVVHGQLVLGVVVGSPESAADGPLADRLRATAAQVAAQTGVQVSVQPTAAGSARQERTARHHVIVLGRPVPPAAVAGAARAIAGVGGNIEAIRRLSDYPVTSFELTVSGAASTELRTALATVAAETGTDIAVEQVGLARRGKRLIVLDVDSTLVRGEVIDELAARAGRAAEVARITAAAMNGELDFEESLRARVAVLAGLPVEVLDEVRAHLVLTPGARTLIRTLQRLGFRCGIVSGGFTQITDPLAAELGLDFAAANTLEVADGRLTGGLVGEVVDRAGKARALARFAAEHGVPLDQTVAVGDGANDLDMLNAAGLGIAFNAKPFVRDQAHAALNQPYLDAVLQVLGFTRDEVLDAV
ncbi:MULTISPECIES: phosphoserine phosphatase SerB [unclassified Modestobacter]|uniref:phosphoserine phosphatase SerB n=1 Tax=unclassified Modestobacter TaxID=2643866 RepID=UPI0022AAF722|nr:MULTISPECIES: phosphoserine phosphatase SerB [unclassified Modestobacter]MCZ2824360.1 phosphoserine phosphatase SerB [Modestobacter sp. VKM Ac-2981]MCZ2854112.1 phosphoserine phosphatase SerB [Modestobacter sp. VKM Ac-2982]